MAQSNNRLEYLDALRGIAAFSVSVHHLLSYGLGSNITPVHITPYVKFLVTDFVNFGLFGVVLFFMISGFIIPISLRQGSTLKRFFVSRVFRLYPAYWIALVLIILTSLVFTGFSGVKYSAPQVFANLTMTPKFFGYTEMSGVFWTLFVEILFYLGCAFLFYFGLLEKSSVIGFLAIALSLTTPLAIIFNKLFDFVFPVQFILFHLSFLFAGSLLRMAVLDNNLQARFLAKMFFLISFPSVLLLSGLFFPVNEAVNAGFVMYHAQTAVIFAYILAVMLFVYTIFSRSIVNRVWLQLGAISYSLYLLHMLCFEYVGNYFSTQTTSTYLTFLVVGFISALSIAWLSYSYIEKPAIALGRKIINSRGL